MEGAPSSTPPAGYIPDIFGVSSWKPPSGLTQEQIKEKFRPFPTHPDQGHSCALNAVGAGVIGFPLGILMALMFQSPELHAIDQQADTKLMTKVKEGLKISFKKGWHQGKSFGTIGLLFSGTECLAEKYRGKADLWNSLIGGWVAGALIAIRAGPAGVISSMAIMTGFSLVMDLGMGIRGYRPSAIFSGHD